MLGQLFPICAKCRVSMRLAALQASDGSARRSSMSVYACGECGRLAAYELPAIEAEDRDTAIPIG